jgi:hypothetical protein
VIAGLAVNAKRVTHAAGIPAANAHDSMLRAISTLVAKPTSSGTPAARQRSRSSVHACGRYSCRSINARPRLER